MNLTSVLGFLVATAVVYGGVIHPSPNPELFLDSHAIILVLGGTLAAAMIAFPAKRLLNLFKMILFGVILKGKSHHRELVIDMVVAAQIARENLPTLALRNANHPFLAESYKLLAEDILSEPELRDVLQRRTKYFKKSYTEDAKLLTALAKFPPAFGLLGASSGMIAMMTNLGKGGQDTIGPAMAVALVATFWGIALANLVFLPLADYGTKAAEEDFFTRQLIIEGIMLIKQKNTVAVVAETLNSFLPLRERITLKMSAEEGAPDADAGRPKSRRLG